ncbi:MAG: glycosyltransferase family 1 protein, partial [Bdellovibrionales bacterium]|nr:glycosyltransferase family 1 protein [Bdellovibrionales bacterium]
RLPDDFQPNRLVYLDDSGPVSVLGLESLPFPTVLYSVDSHHHANWHRCLAAMFDLVLVAQKKFMGEVSAFGTPASWFPLWAPTLIEPAEVKSVDVCFRGNLDPNLHPKRAAFFERLSRLVDIDVGTGDYRNVFCKSKIVVNQAVRDDLNFRVFETMMCGALLLTPDDSSGLQELFTSGIHLETYKSDSAEDAAGKIRYYLDHEAERAAIASAGRDEVLAKHTSEARARDFARILERISLSARSSKYFGAGGASIFGAKVSSRVSQELADHFLSHAVSSMIRSARDHERRDNAFISTSHFVKYFLEVRGQYEEAIVFMKKLVEAYPNEPFLLVSYSESLRIAGKEEQAQEVIRRFSQNAQVFLDKAENALRLLREDIMGQLRGAVPGHALDDTR